MFTIIGLFHKNEGNQGATTTANSTLPEGGRHIRDDHYNYGGNSFSTNSFDYSSSPFETAEYSFQSLDMLLAGMDGSSINHSSLPTTTTTSSSSSSSISTKFISAMSLQSTIHVDSIDSISLSPSLLSPSPSTTTTTTTTNTETTNKRLLSIVTERGIDVIRLILDDSSIAY